MRNREQLVVARRIGVCIREARQASALSRNQVARSSGLTGRELARYEHGRDVPCRRDVQALAGACGVNMGDLLPAELMEQLPEAPASERSTPEDSNDEPVFGDEAR